MWGGTLPQGHLINSKLGPESFQDTSASTLRVNGRDSPLPGRSHSLIRGSTPAVSPLRDEGVGRLQLTQKAEAICVDPLHTSERSAQVLRSRELKELCLEPQRSSLHSLPLVLHLRRHSRGIPEATGLCSGSQRKPPWGTHTPELRARQTPFVNLKEIAIERVRLQEILPFPQTRRRWSLSSMALMDS